MRDERFTDEHALRTPEATESRVRGNVRLTLDTLDVHVRNVVRVVDVCHGSKDDLTNRDRGSQNTSTRETL